MANGFWDWLVKVADVSNRAHWRLVIIQLVICVPSWALAGWISTFAVDRTSVVSFPARQYIPMLLPDFDVVAGGRTFEVSIVGVFLGPAGVIATITTILVVESFAFALCASVCVATLSAAGRRATVMTGLRLATKRVWPVLGWSLACLTIVIIGFELPLLAGIFFLGAPLAILVSFAVGIHLMTVFVASLIGVITFERTRHSCPPSTSSRYGACSTCRSVSWPARRTSSPTPN